MRAHKFLENLLSAATFATIIGLSAPAFAADCDNTAYFGLYSNYPYQDLGVPGSDQPVVQGGNTTTCGAFEFDNWGSGGKTDEKNQKNLGAVEYDLSGTYTKDVPTPIGVIKTRTTVAYYAFNFEGMSKTRDDAFDFHIDLSRAISVGDVTIAPFVRVTRIQFVDGGGLDFVRPGVRFNGPITDKWSYSMEASTAMNRTSDVDTDRFQGDLNYAFGNGWGGNLRLKLTEDLDPMVGGGFSYSW